MSSRYDENQIEAAKDELFNMATILEKTAAGFKHVIIRDLRPKTTDTSVNEFIRDHEQVLGDQANNPGSMNIGPRARNFGAYDSYEGTPGNKTAIFPTMAHGTAALIDRILSNKGVTVREYIMGGPKIPTKFSYSGGWNYENYLRAMEQMGVSPSEIITGDPQQMNKMVNAHSFGEGNKFRVPSTINGAESTKFANEIHDLLSERSDYYLHGTVQWVERPASGREIDIASVESERKNSLQGRMMNSSDKA